MSKIYKTCVQCDHDFYISEKDQEFFASRELEMPKRCWSCRQQNRKTKQAAIDEQATQTWEDRPSNQRSRARSPRQADPPPRQPTSHEDNPNGGTVEFFVPVDNDWTQRYRTNDNSGGNGRKKRRRHRKASG